MPDTDAITVAPRVRVYVVDGDDDARAAAVRTLLDDGLWITGDFPHVARLGTPADLTAADPTPALVILDPDTAADPGAPGAREVLDALDAAPLPTRLLCLLHSAARDRAAVLAWLRRGVIDYVDKNAGRDGELPRITRRLLRRLTDPGATDRPTAWIATGDLPTGWVELSTPSAPECPERLRVLARALAAREWPADQRDDLLAAVEEAVANAMEWGNRSDPDKRVRLSFALFDDRIVFKCVDEGEGFRPEEVPDPWGEPGEFHAWRAARNKRPGGRGLSVLYAVMDEVVYSEKGNTVVMTKWLPRTAGG